MPIVALPDGREVEFPEGASPDLIQGALRKDFPQFFADPRTTRKADLQAQQATAREEGEDISWGTGYRAEQAAALGNVGRGVAQVPAGTLKFAGTVADSVRRWAPDASQVGQLGVGGDQSALTTAGEWIEQQANRLPSNDPDALDAQFQTGIGQLGGMMAGGGLVGKLAGKAVTRGALAAGGSEKAAERLAGRAVRAYGQGGAVAAGFGQEFSDAFERAQRLGDDPDTALAKSLGYASVATMIESAAGAGRVFRQYFPSPQQAQQALTKLGVSRAVAGNFLAGYGEEASQRIAQNVIVEPGSDPLSGANEEGRVGALVQGLVGLPSAGRGYRPATTRTPDGREIIVNQETGTTEFADPTRETPTAQPTAAVFRGANGEDIRVDLGGATLEQAQTAIFRQNPGAEFVGLESQTDLTPATPPTTAAPAATAEAATPGLSLEPIQFSPDPLEGQPYDLTPAAPAPTVPPPSAGASGAGTITGPEVSLRDERTGSAMPAEREKRPTEAPALDRPWDLLDELESAVGGKIDPKLIREANPNWKPSGQARKLFKSGGYPADKALNAITYAGPKLGLEQGTKLDQLGEAINAAAKARFPSQHKENVAIKHAEAQNKQFSQKVLQGQRPKGREDTVEVVPAGGLVEGDSFTVQGHKFEVEEVFVNDAGEFEWVRVKDGPKFGVNTVFGEITLKIDYDSLERDEPKVKPGENVTYRGKDWKVENTTGNIVTLRNGSETDATHVDLVKAARPAFSLAPAESVPEQQARLATEQAAREAKAAAQAQQGKLAELQAKPLQGTTGDLGQGDLLNAPQDLFAPPSPGDTLRETGGNYGNANPDLRGRQQRGDAAGWQLPGKGKQPEQDDLYLRHALRHRASPAATLQLQRASAATARKAELTQGFARTSEGGLDFKRPPVELIDALFKAEQEHLDALRGYWAEVDKSGVKYPSHASFLARIAKADFDHARNAVRRALKSTSQHPDDVRLRNELQGRWLELSGLNEQAARELLDMEVASESAFGIGMVDDLARLMKADATVRDYLGGTSANPFLDPQFWQAVAVSGARMLRDLGQFTATRAQWGAAMVKRFGDRIRKALDTTWNRLMRLQTQQTNGVSAIGQGHLNQIEVASGNTNIAAEELPVYDEATLAQGNPGLLTTLAPASKQLAYFGGQDLRASKQKLDVTGALQAAAVKKQSDALWQQLVESSASGNPLTKWKLPAWLIGSPRAREFKQRVLHVAARLNATGRDAAGNFTFADFTMRAGTMSLGTAKQSQLSVGDQFTVNDPLTGVTETLTLGPIITTPEGRVFHQLNRAVDAGTQAELYQHYAREFPDMIWFLDMFIDPALAGVRQTVNGIEVPVFNRFAAAAMMADGNPNFTPLTAYTPDVLVTRSLLGSIRGMWHRAGTRSPGRRYKSGTSREGGHVRDLLSGFNVRTWQMLQEKTRREWMQAVLKSATPIRKNQVPEGWVKLETGMEELWQAVKRLRNWKSPEVYKDVTDEVENGGIEEVEANLEKGQYLKKKGNRWFKFDKLYPETEARLTERGEVNDADLGLEYKHFFGEVARLRGDQLMLPKALVDQLVRKYVSHVEHGTLYRLGSWLVRNSTQMFLVAPVTVVNNVLTNDLFTLEAATRRILSGVAGGNLQDLRFAKELFTAEAFKWFPGLRTLVDPQWRAAMNAGVLPENLFADQTMLADLKVRLDEDPMTYLRQGELGAAALNFIRYGTIDVRAKTRMAYAWLRAQAVTNARKAGLRGAAQRAAVDSYLANPPVADLAAAVEVAGFELLNYADSPAWLENLASGNFTAFGAKVDVGDFGRLVMPFPRFGYHYVAKNAARAAAVKVLFGKVPKGQRADAFADLITFLMWPAGGLGILAAYGLKGLGDDDDEARKRVGTASIKTTDADGNVVSKPLPRELITSNRINLSAWARGLGLGTDREEDFWLRVRSYPVIAMAGAALLAEEDARKFGADEGAKTYASAVKDLASDFFSVGWLVKVPAKVLGDLGNNRRERTVVDPYAAGVPTVAYVTDQTLDSVLPGTRQFDLAVKWMDPVQRRRASSKTLGFEPNVWDAARVGHVTGLMDRLFAGADSTTGSTLPPEGAIDRRSHSVPVPQEYTLQQRIAELAGFNLRPIDRRRYEDALAPYATRN